MIKANELRIGNVVLFCPDGKRHHTIKPRECKVVAVQQDKVVVLDLGQHLSLWPDQPEMQGIPLTPERLERLGFEWETEFKKHLELPLPEQGINSRRLAFYYKDGKCEMLQFYMDAYFGGYFETKPPEYLHQLQNLFFALTSTELREPVK